MGWVQDVLKRFSGTPPERPAAGGTHRTLTKANFKKFEQEIGYSIKNKELFGQALLHRSSLQRANSSTHSNERLEFLGDSVLNLIVAEHLFNRYPNAEEGDLTKLRSRLVNRKALIAYARQIHLLDFILMGPSAAQSPGKGSETIVADTYEAIIAAIYLDGGFAEAKKFVERQVLTALEGQFVVIADENYKSMLLEYSQSRGLGTPRYSIIQEVGPDHDRTFTVEVAVGNVKKGRGTGKNKKEAEQAAARKALDELQ